MLSPCLLNFYAEYVMQKASLTPGAARPAPLRGLRRPRARLSPRVPYLKAGGWAVRSSPRPVRPSSQEAEGPA